jgi:hypothetical protein
MRGPSTIGKTLVLLTLSFMIIPNYDYARPIIRRDKGSFRPQAGRPREARSEVENPPIIKENTVVFLSLSQDDYDAFVKKTPTIEDRLTEVLHDFYFYAKKVAEKLKAQGISAEFGHWKELYFQLTGGKIEKRTFNPEDAFGLALYAKGKPPLMVRSAGHQKAEIGEKRCTPDFFSMAAVISEYFGVKIEWREKCMSIR